MIIVYQVEIRNLKVNLKCMERKINVIKIGIIGTNWISERFVAALKATDNGVLTSVYSRQEQTASQFIEKVAVPNVTIYTDLEKFLTSNEFDTVYIASPNSLHFEQAKMAIMNQINVIVEKPAFLNPDEMQAIQKLLTQYPGVKYFEAARQIHTPNFKKIAKAVSNLEVLSGAELTYSKYSSRYDDVLNGQVPNVFSLDFGGGALQDLGVYPVYDAVALFGIPQAVKYYPQIISTGVDGKGTAVLTYSQYQVVLNFSKISNSAMISEIYGGKDTIQIDDAGEINQVVYVDQEQTRHVLADEPLALPMLPEVKAFLAVISDPDNHKNQLRYRSWLQLSIDVNQILFDLRKSAQITFTDEEK